MEKAREGAQHHLLKRSVETPVRVLVLAGAALVDLLGVSGAVAAVSAPAAPASGTQYPTRPVRLIVPYPAGGGVDRVGRIVASKLGENLGQQIVVDNRPGANGIIGSEVTARATPDGYTMLIQSIAHAINASLYRKLPYDTVRDFAGVATLITQSNLLVAHPSIRAGSVKELIALAQAKPGSLSFASPGSGSSPHLSGELFKTMAGIDILHVSYKGGAPAMNDLIAGRVSLYFSAMSTALPLAKSGKVKALAITSAARSRAAPDVPTVAETLPGYESDTWFALFVPAATPRRIIATLNEQILKVLRVPDVRDHLSANGAEIVGDTPEQLTARVKADIAKWARVVHASGARID